MTGSILYGGADCFITAMPDSLAYHDALIPPHVPRTKSMKPAIPPLRQAFRFCPRCARPEPDLIAERQLQCPDCGLRFFFNTAAAVGAFVFVGEQLILCERAKDPGKGLLGVPGGFIDFDESIEDGLRREIQEELNIEVTALRYLTSCPNTYLYADVLYKTADLYYVCQAANPDALRPADDVADCFLIHPDAVDPAQFAFDSARRAFSRLRETLADV